MAKAGLLSIAVPQSLGGPGLDKQTVIAVTRIISAVDPSIGQLPQNHFQFADAVARYGTVDQRKLLLGAVLRGDRFGNAVAERSGTSRVPQHTLLRTEPSGRLRLDGKKYYSTGALTAQWVPVQARNEHDQTVWVYLPRDVPGLRVQQDWTAFGQRSTISGTTEIVDVTVRPEWVVYAPVRGDAPDTFAAFGQAIHAAVDVGIASGALDDAVRFLNTRSRPALHTDIERASDDPHVILRFGQFQTRLHAAEALLARAGRLLDAADDTPTPHTVTAARLAVAEAKAFGAEVALNIASDALDLLGASATDEEHALDRHWRNARTHTLHDANRYKYVHVGNHLVHGLVPDPDNRLI